MSNIDTIMHADGFVPASAAAEAVGRDLSTIHRWAQQEKVRSARSARLLYVDLASLKELHEGNAPILRRLDALANGAEVAAS